MRKRTGNSGPPRKSATNSTRGRGSATSSGTGRSPAKPGPKASTRRSNKPNDSRRTEKAAPGWKTRSIDPIKRRQARKLPPVRKPDSVFTDETKATAKEQESLLQGHRLQKVLAAAGFGSRRECEELISEGRVQVDGKVVSQLGAKVLPHSQEIRVDGEALPKMRPVYLALNKPKGYLCTNRDQQGRRRAIDLIPHEFGRLFPVGRLDQNSEGLLLVTNDGALAQRLTHPRYEVPKKYRVQVAGIVEPSLVYDLKKGIHLAEAVVQADDVVLKSSHKQSSILEIVLKEGKNREIRRMLARLGHKVMQLKRIAVGPVKLGKILPGEFRRLTKTEVNALYRSAELRALPEK